MEYDLFTTLDHISSNTTKKDIVCCDLDENHIHSEYDVIICKICSNSISNIIDSPDKIYSSDSGKVPRHGMPINALLPKSSVGTTVSGNYSSMSMNRIEKYQKWNSMPYKERSLYMVFTDIDRRCRDNDIPDIISKTAKSLYTLVAETKISRGNNRKGIIASCVFNACKECHNPRSSNEISKIFEIDSKTMTKGMKKYTEIMRLNKKNISRITNIKSISIDDFIDRFSYKLHLSNDNIIDIKYIVDKCKLLKIDKDNTPPAMASGCIFLYTKIKSLNINKKDISNITQISEVTINKCYKKISEHPDIKSTLEKLTLN